jgi:hypothetical protein
MTKHDAEVLHEYAGDLMKRNGPHASQIKGVALALLGGIIWRADAGTIEFSQPARPAVALALEIGGNGYVGGRGIVAKTVQGRTAVPAMAHLDFAGGVVVSKDVQAIFRGP